MNEALASLVLAASVAGGPAVTPVATPRAVPVRRAAAHTEVARAPLASVAAATAAGVLTRDFGGAPLTLAISFDEKADSWLTLRRGAWSASFSESAAAAGAPVALPGGAATLTRAGGVWRLATAGATLTATEKELIDALYAAARKFTLGPVTYAAVWEDGARTPAALDLLRRDADGNYFVTYRSPAQMRGGVQWFLGADMILYGMRFDGNDLVFVSEPVPPAAARRR
ncbi:MAG: hypothetical protein HY079_12115 [Elusimicrobia bacterium]|nr:hypothetical protein [Elusimicrobiota bacterium]